MAALIVNMSLSVDDSGHLRSTTVTYAVQLRFRLGNVKKSAKVNIVSAPSFPQLQFVDPVLSPWGLQLLFLFEVPKKRRRLPGRMAVVIWASFTLPRTAVH